MRRCRQLRAMALAAAAGAALVVTGCGFALQGTAALPPEMERTRVEIQDPYSPFARRLQTLLQQNGVDVVQGDEATAILEVPVNQVLRQILTIGESARVREYRVIHRVHFRLLDGEREELIPLSQLEQVRDINFDDRDVLASEREEEFLRQDLADTLSRMVLRQLATAPLTTAAVAGAD